MNFNSLKHGYLALLIILSVSIPVFAQNLLTQDFTETTFPPAGWTIDVQAAHWTRSTTNNAGGTSPECKFSWSPQFNGNSYFISPVLDLTGVGAAYLEFRQMVDHYGTGYSVGVATRSNNGTWHSVYLVTPSESIPAEMQSIRIENADVGSDAFQVAFYFSGDSYQINYWYFDDIRLYPAPTNDVAVQSVDVETYMTFETPVAPTATVENTGLNLATFTAQLQVYRWTEIDFTYSGSVTGTLNPGETGTLTFPTYTPTIDNEIYKFEVTITSPGDENPDNDTAVTWANTYTTPRQKVILEIGTGTWCTYCPGAALGADDLVDGGYNVAVVENHNGDVYANTYSDGRNDFYGIAAFPTAVFDGQLTFVGGSHTESMFNNYLPLYNQMLQRNSPAEIHIYGEATGGAYNIMTYVQRNANSNLDSLIVHQCLTQSNIQVAWQGQTHLNFVNRMMFPNLNGTPTDLLHCDGHSIYTTFTLDPTWGGWDGDFELVCFIQNPVTKEIIQGNSVNLLDLQPMAADDNAATTVPVTLKGNYPNPFSQSTSISFNTNKAADVSIRIYNTKGQLVRSLLNETMPKGEHEISWDGRNDKNENCGSGIYIMKLQSGNTVKTAKLMMYK